MTGSVLESSIDTLDTRDNYPPQQHLTYFHFHSSTLPSSLSLTKFHDKLHIIIHHIISHHITSHSNPKFNSRHESKSTSQIHPLI